MKRFGAALLAVAIVLPAYLMAQSLTEQFQAVKGLVNGGAWLEALKGLEKLELDAAKPGNEASQRQLEGPVAFYRGVCEANLDRTSEAIASFREFLRLQPTATLEAGKYSKKVVATFDQAGHKNAAKPFSLAEAYRSFRPTVMKTEEREVIDRYWANGPTRWIMTGDEKREWEDLKDPQPRVEFVERFWASRAELTSAQGRPFREEYERRVAFADSYLGQGGEVRGSLTDRGMVFILLGPPSSASRRLGSKDHFSPDGDSVPTIAKNPGTPMYTGTAGAVHSSITVDAVKESDGSTSHIWNQLELPALGAEDNGEILEIWHYRGDDLPGGVGYLSLDVHYVTKRGYGHHVLQRDPEILTTLAAAKAQRAPAVATARK